MSRKKLFLVVDVETAEDTDTNPLPYDIGYAVADRKGNIYLERSFIVADIFLDLADSMKSAYYAKKIPHYWEDIKAGKRTLAPMWNIYKIMRNDMRAYRIDTVCAYNMSFDREALNNLVRYCSKSRKRYWFPFGTTFNCIWSMACQMLLARRSYIQFALKNGLVSNAGNLQTSAEATFKYLTKQVEFIESHTGLEDVKIEVDIMAKCYAQKKRMDKSINRMCWRLPQNKRKELGL